MQNYDREILKTLTEVGERGLSIAKISLHVYNACNTLFASASYEDVHRYVAQYLLRNSKNPDSIIEKTERGIYHLNLRSKETQQLMLQFSEEQQPVVEEKPQDLSLSLF
jgi:hypothetical protein